MPPEREPFACLLLISNYANEVYPRWLNIPQPVFKYILTHDQHVSVYVSLALCMTVCDFMHGSVCIFSGQMEAVKA